MYVCVCGGGEERREEKREAKEEEIRRRGKKRKTDFFFRLLPFNSTFRTALKHSQISVLSINSFTIILS
jgi:hypothetical protein